MTFIPAPSGIVSTVQSTTVPLAANASWTPSYENVLTFSSITIIIFSDVVGTLTAYFSSDGVNDDKSIQLSNDSLDILNETHSLIISSKYFKISYQNSLIAQTSFRLQVIYNDTARASIPISNISENLNSYSDVMNVKSALTAQNTSGKLFTPIYSSSEGALLVYLSEPRTAFGEITVVNPTPVVQIDFIYGLNEQLIDTTVTGSGSVSTANGILQISSGASVNSSAQLHSLRYMKYRAGQGAQGRYTALFTPGVVGNKQYAGLFTPTMSDGFGVGFNETEFGFVHIYNGVETWTLQNMWNVDTFDGSGLANNPSGIFLDPTKGNVYQIQYQYLGFGDIFLRIENAVRGTLDKAHIVKFANNSLLTSVRQPSLNLVWRSENISNTSNMLVQAGSGGLFLEGIKKLLGPRYGANNTKTITTVQSILTLKNALNFNGVINRSEVQIRNISFGISCNGSAVAVLSVIKNASLGGTPVYTPINGTTIDNGNSITSGSSTTSVDIQGTIPTGGTIFFNSACSSTAGTTVDVSEFDIYMSPGDTLTFSVSATPIVTSVTASVAVTWNDDV